MKRWVVLIILFVHVNFSMCLAQVDDMPTYDQLGRSKEDANIHTQYAIRINTDHHRRSARNEEEGNGRYFHLVKLGGYCFDQQGVEIRKPPADLFYQLKYPLVQDNKLNAVFTEKPTPPPKYQDQYA